MSEVILLNKPYGVICQFSESGNKITLSQFVDVKGFYPAGRLDEQSEGLLVLTSDGKLQARISHPKFKLAKTYWVQIEGVPSIESLAHLRKGVQLKDGKTQPAKVKLMDTAPLPERDPPVRFRATIPTSWLSITISEGKNRQVRRMTAAVGHPTLRLFRHSIGPWQVDGLAVGQYRREKVNLPG